MKKFFARNKKEKVPEVKPKEGYFNDLIPSLCWLEIGVLDLERAVLFYEKVFECKFEFQEYNGFQFAFFKTHSTTLKGTLVKVDEISNKGVKLYFNVDGKLSGILSRIEKNGGKIIEPKRLLNNEVNGKTIIPNNAIGNRVGYLTTIEDSEGNEIILYTNS